jgi:type IV secretion system protein VirB4
MRWINQKDIPSVGELMGLSELIRPSVFLLDDGCVGSVIQLRSQSLATNSLESIRELQRIWHQAISGLAEENACMITEYRHRVSLGVEQKSDNHFISTLIEPQVKRNYYQQDLYLTLLCKPSFLEKKNRKHRKTDFCLDQLVLRLEQLCALVFSMMKPFRPRLLTGRQSSGASTSLLDVLSLVVNAGYQPSNTSCTTGSDLLCTEKLGSHLTNKQLLIGREITYLGVNQKACKFASIVSIKRYPAESTVAGSCALNRLNFEWVRVHTFEPLAKDSSMRCIQKQRSKLQSVSDQAISQREALCELEDQVAGEQVTVGYHQHSVLVFADDKEALDKQITDLQACLVEQGYGCVREALGLEVAFWALQAGGVRRGIRKSLITSVNFSHLSSVGGFSTGHAGNNHLKRPICLLETQERMPYYFNFHRQGSKTNPSLGHTLILGASNSGKTVLLTYLDAMRSGLGGYRFFFDRDKGAYLYFKAIGGQYIRLDPLGSAQLNPLTLDDTAENRRFLTAWLEQMALASDGNNMSAEDRSHLRACVDYAYDSLQPSQRFLSNALRMLPCNYPYLANFSPWLKAEGSKMEGEFHHYFDNVQDTLDFSRATAFDMTYLLDQAPSLLRKLVLMYIFHRIEQVCQGELVTITLDEGWQYFSDPYWRERMRSWLPTLRKMNAHLVIATQSPGSIQSSGVQDIVLDNCPTHLYFGNDKACEKTYLDFLKLTQEELAVVRSFPQSARWMLLKHGGDSVVVRLNMEGLQRYLPILSANAKNIGLLKKIVGGSAPGSWVDPFLAEVDAAHG